MKKVYVNAYLANNLGDDIFVDMLVNRYKNCMFYTQTGASYRKFKKHQKAKNLKIYSGPIIKLIDGTINVIFNRGKVIGRKILKKCDLQVSIGGSIFMEFGNMKRIKKHFSLYLERPKKPYYIIGANFGPYKTDEYKNLIKTILNNAENVCFRDKYSVNQFKDVRGVRYAPDILFSLDTKNYLNDIKNKNFNNKDKMNENNSRKNVVFSVIDPIKKMHSDINGEKLYIKNTVKMIKFFLDKDYTITLMSFCKLQGDEKMCKNILKEIKKEINKTELKRINAYFYRGNISEALDILNRSDLVVGSRFHANILGMVLDKTIIPMAYSDKLINVLDDIGFYGKVFDLRENKEINENDLNDIDLNYKFNISEIRLKAEEHFKYIDKILKE